MLWPLQYEVTQLFCNCILPWLPIHSPIVWLITIQQPHLQGTSRMLRAVINVLSDINCRGWSSDTKSSYLMAGQLSSANGLNLRLKIFLSDSNIPPPRRFVASLSHGFQPQTMEFRANPTEFRANPSRIPIKFRVGQSLMRWRAGFGQSVAISCLASPLLSPFLNVPPSPEPLGSFVHTLRHYEELFFRVWFVYLDKMKMRTSRID